MSETEEPSDESVTNAQVNLSMIEAVRELVGTIQRINTMFVRLAIGVPIVLVLFMFVLALWIINEGQSKSDEVIGRIMAVRQNMQQQQSQNVTIESDQIRLIREILIEQGHLKRKAD